LDLEHDDGLGSSERDVVKVHIALLAGYYSMTLMTLYRPLLTLPSAGTNDIKLRNTSTRVVFQSTKAITDLFTRLYAAHSIDFLPDTAIAILEPAVVTHLLHSTSEMPKVRETSYQKFYLCWRVLLDFRKSYYLADTAIAMLNAAAQRLKATTPEPAAYSDLIKKLGVTRSHVSTAEISVPFVQVVGNFKRDRSALTPDEDAPISYADHATRPISAFEATENRPGSEAELGLDTSVFDQLLCWDSLEDDISC